MFQKSQDCVQFLWCSFIWLALFQGHMISVKINRF